MKSLQAGPSVPARPALGEDQPWQGMVQSRSTLPEKEDSWLRGDNEDLEPPPTSVFSKREALALL